MRNKDLIEAYEPARLEIVLFELSDIVRTSGGFDNSGNEDDGGWTDRT